MNKRRPGECRCSKCKKYSSNTVKRRGFRLCPSCLKDVEPRDVSGRILNTDAQRALVSKLLGGLP